MWTRLQIEAAERGLVPDPLVRWGIRRLLPARLREEAGAAARRERDFLAEMDAAPVALAPERANQQHYEWPPAFFERVLGHRLKYSCCLFEPAVDSLDAAEDAMLALTCERARLEDGMDVLELGCGWGSLSLWIAERHPGCRITAVSNSALQRDFIRSRAAARGLDHVEVVTADMNDFAPVRSFDRVVSVEMFEHMRNWRELLSRIGGWLRPSGLLFLHYFSHRSHAYPYEAEGEADWMARHFFTGGMMPSEPLIHRFREHLEVEEQWRVSGTHYQRTSEAWLRNLDAARAELRPVLEETVGAAEADRALSRWRLFFLAVAEFFAYRGGEEWGVTHVRLAPREAG